MKTKKQIEELIRNLLEISGELSGKKKAKMLNNLYKVLNFLEKCKEEAE